MSRTDCILVIGIHYIQRKLCEGLAMLSISPEVVKGFFSNPWTIFELVAIVLTIVAWSLHGKNSGEWDGVNSLVVGFLWLRVFAVMKVIHRDMSTFILSLFEILYDIRYFMFVLIVFVLMFGDMLHLAGKFVQCVFASLAGAGSTVFVTFSGQQR